MRYSRVREQKKNNDIDTIGRVKNVGKMLKMNFIVAGELFAKMRLFEINLQSEQKKCESA